MKRMLTKKLLSRMKGLTVLETMLALAIGALVILAIVIFYISTKTSATTSKVITDMNSIVAAADSYIAGGQPASNLSSDAITPLIDAGLLPNPINDPWGQQYTATVAVSTGTSSTITITVPGIAGGDSNCNAITSATKNAQGVTAGSGTGCSFTYTL